MKQNPNFEQMKDMMDSVAEMLFKGLLNEHLGATFYIEIRLLMAAMYNSTN